MRIIGAILAIFLMSGAGLAEAHQIKSDHGVTVLLHVEPSDEPYSGTTTPMYLVFMQGQGSTIDVSACDCIAYIAPYGERDTIKETGRRFDLAQLERVMGGYNISHVFPRHDVYAVVLEGTPKEGASFEPFRIVYDLRVARGEELEEPSERGWMKVHLLTGGVVLLVLVGILIGRRYWKKK